MSRYYLLHNSFKIKNKNLYSISKMSQPKLFLIWYSCVKVSKLLTILLSKKKKKNCIEIKLKIKKLEFPNKAEF